MEETLIQWHPAFVAAMQLELTENREDLYFEGEHNLNTRPLEVDLLVIKKTPSAQIKNEIGRFFRQYNLLEYKSPEDQFDIDVLYKVIGYACLYKSYGEKVDSRQAEEITVSIVREAKPRKLFRYLQNHQIAITNPYPGIYYLPEGFLFPVQILVTKELEADTHMMLKALTKNLKKESLWKLLGYVRQLEGKWERSLVDSVLEVSIQANETLVKEWRGDSIMYQALMRIMEPEIKQYIEESKQEGRQEGRREGIKEGIKEAKEEGIQNLILTLQELGMDREGTKEIVFKRYSLSENELEQYMNKFFG